MRADRLADRLRALESRVVRGLRRARVEEPSETRQRTKRECHDEIDCKRQSASHVSRRSEGETIVRMATDALTRLPGSRGRARADVEPRRVHRSFFPVLDGGEDGPSARLAAALGRDRPKLTFFVGLFIAFLAIAAASIALGLLLTEVLLPHAGLASADERFVRSLTDSRSSGLMDASLIGSMIAGGVVLPIVAGVTALAAGLTRQWRVVGFLVFALALEAAVYRATTLAVHRERPDVHRLEGLPADASYSSGHTAAAIAVYGGIALLVDLADPKPVCAGRDLGGSRSRSRFSSRSRACTAACTIRSTRRRRPRRYRRRGRDGARLPRGRSRGRRAGGALTTSVPKVAVVAHAGKTFGGGLVELRRVLEERGHRRSALGARCRRAARLRSRSSVRSKDGAELIFVWGGDGTVQRCLDAVAGTKRARRDRAGRDGEPVRDEPRHPAGHRAGRRDRPPRRAAPRSTSGRFNGERFGVMAGAGFDAAMIRDADGGLKDRLGRVAYVWTGSKNLRAKPFKAKISVDGASWYDGKASCILVGNVGELFGGRRGLRGREPRRRQARARGRERRRHGRLGPHARAHRGRQRRPSSPFVRVDEGAARSKSSSTARCCTSSTAAIARRCERSR